MKRISVSSFGGPSVLKYSESPLPSVGSGQVRIRVHSAGVNPADTYIRGGTYEFFKPSLPFTPGFDAAGVVDCVSDDVHDFRPGDRVFTLAMFANNTGAYSQYLVCDADAVHPLPEHLSFHQGAAIGIPFLTAYRAVFQRGAIRESDVVLVHGASGGVGIPTVQLALTTGATVIGTAGTPSGRKLLSALGTHHVLDHTCEDYLDDIQNVTSGNGVDLIVEMVADKNLNKDLEVLAQHGRVVVVGSRANIDFTPRLLMVKEADIRGIALWNMSSSEVESALTDITRLLHSAKVTPIVGDVFPLQKAGAAHDSIGSAHAPGKVVLDCQ